MDYEKGLKKLKNTQKVVVILLRSFPSSEYHVLLDSIFSCPQLFLVLRIINIATTGTAPLRNGIEKEFVKLKKEDQSKETVIWNHRVTRSRHYALFLEFLLDIVLVNASWLQLHFRGPLQWKHCRTRPE